MHLAVGTRTYDITTRALVMGVLGAPEELVEQGADLLEVGFPDRALPVPVCVVGSGDAGIERALTAGASLVRLSRPTIGALKRCAAAGAAVIVPPGAAPRATAAGIPPDQIVPDTLLVDVVGDDCPVAATAVGVVRGARIVRTTDVRGARRICDVLATVLEAR